MTEISVDKVNGDNSSDNFSNSVIPILIYWETGREQEEGKGGSFYILIINFPLF